MKRDWIFVAAGVLFLAGIGIFISGYPAGLLVIVAAYLLRPALNEFGLARESADERQLSIHSRSGNIGFLVVILSAAGFALWRLSRGEQAEDLLQVILFGLAARALTDLVMIGEYRKAGVMIISTIGAFVALFLVAEAGFSVPALAGVIAGALILGVGQLGRRFPLAVAILLVLIIALAIIFFRLYEFRALQSTLWLLFVLPLSVSVACLVLGRGSMEENITPRQRSFVFGGLGAAAVIVFTLLLVLGGRDLPVTRRTAAGPVGAVVEIQGIPCVGSVTYDAKGTLQSCTLGRDDTLSGQPLAAGTVIHLTAEGVLDWCFLQENTMIQGHFCLGSRHDFMTGFHPNGKLKTAWLAQDESIEGIPCARFRFLSKVFGGGDRTTFHDNGRLHLCTLSAPATIQGKLLNKHTVVEFDSDGKLVQTHN
jgi:hypothetical protein